MRPSAAMLLLVPALLSAQSVGLDDGRLDPAWFGLAATFQPSKTLGFQWVKPGLDLRKRTLQFRAWEAPAWLLGHREMKDQVFLRRVGEGLPKSLDRGVRRGLKGSLPVAAAGDLHLVARVVDAVGQADDYMATGQVAVSFDVKLVDGDTGELLAAFHDTIGAPGADFISGRFEQWGDQLGRLLAASATPAPTAKAPQAIAAPLPPPPPPFDLEGALRRIEGLKRDGLLSEAEYLALRKKAAEKAGPPR